MKLAEKLLKDPERLHSHEQHASKHLFCMQGRVLGIDGQFLPKIVEVAISLSAGCDQDVQGNADRIKQEVAREEDRCACPVIAFSQQSLTSRGGMLVPVKMPVHYSCRLIMLSELSLYTAHLP